MIVSEPADQQCSSKFPELQFSSACQRIISYVSPYTLYIFTGVIVHAGLLLLGTLSHRMST